MGLLRVLLAVSVLMAHTGQLGKSPYLSGFGSANAIEAFFVISGFYISLILDKSYSTKIGFYRNRILRLYPIYFIICFFVILRSLFLPSIRSDLFSYPGKALALGSLANSTFFGSDWIMFLQWHNNNLHFGNFENSEFPLWHMLFVPQSWSLGIEVTFYLLAPLLCRAKSRTIIGLGLTLSLVRVLAYSKGLNSDPWTYRFFPFEMPMFILGILIYRLKSYFKNPPKISVMQSYLMLVLLFFLFPLILQKSNLGRFIQLLVLLIITTLIIIFGAESTKDKKLGEFSYPIYMSHILVITVYSTTIAKLSEKFIIFEKLNNPVGFATGSLLITLLASYLLLHLVKPIERIRDVNRK